MLADEPAQKADSRLHRMSRWQEPSKSDAKPETSELPQSTRAVPQRADDEWSTVITDARTGAIFRDLLYPHESQRSLASETCEEIDSTSVCTEQSRSGTVPNNLSAVSTRAKNAKVTSVVSDGSQNRLREPVLIKTTTVSRTPNTVSEQGHCERLDWVELQQRIASDRGLFGNRHALGLERYLNATEIAEATRLGVPGTMRASDGFLHDEMDYLREFNLEERAVEEAVARYRAFTQNAMQRGDVSCLQPSQRLLLSWFYPVTMAIHQEQERIRRGELSLHSSIYGPHLLRLKPEVLAVIVLHETLGRALQDRAGVSFCRVSLAVGRSVQAEINLQRLRELHAEQRRQKLPEDRALRRTIALSASGSGGSRVIASINAAARRMELDNIAWDDSVAIKVGSALISFAMKNAMIHLETPSGKQAVQAFRHTYRPTNRGHRRMGVIELHNSVIDLLLANEGDLRETILPRFQPMIVPPRPWTAYNRGGYLRPRGLVMRIRGSRLQLEALKKGDLSEVYAGLNALGATPWRVNRPVLDVVEKLWQAGGDVAGLVARADLQMPSLTDSTVNAGSEGSVPASSDAISIEQKRAIWRIRKTNRERHALRCELHYRLETAREFAHVSRFYLPHNLDFRGRAYPMPSHLHHMSSDVSRGLLTFAEPGLRLGERGLFWLKVHLANLCGKNKLPFEERVAFAESVMPKVLAVAAAPTADANLDWWARQEEPFQLLATCFELAASKGGRDPDYCCTLPVHQDGSCNGLQHYAALGRDACGGAQVNLLPSDRPQDVYSGVAELVRERVAQEAREGVPIAKLLDGRICRKIVKQTVMTSVYGVTLVGAREQIQNRLRELADFPDDMLWQASYYLAKHTLGSLGDIFRGATDTMEWLAECAFRVATSRERTNAVYWITPLGLPVIQPYRRREARLVNTVVQHVLLEEQNDQLPVSRARQRSAFPPNYIHSLDSTHMLMTALACQRAGLQFAAVHDSFWTHAANVDQMNCLLRESFVRLHSRDLLQELREQFQLHFPEVELPPVPPKGTLDLNQVLLSPYFFN
ncbi:hypothetical protein F1559_000697 [Cyanidiococcus yangmingshanensis]|uniref:DNA-directed RNA polymerase n=1 Tax=Cyanidiococcus yangmingshanensis TaxID=2690220 RepID=A0A7J7IML5_9RHOD|nr:hypothetical protein F1559_000697 [Cyanidiococcus yangmingshanensis]